MGQTSVGRLHGRLDVLQTSFPPSPSWIQDGDAGNDVIQDLGYFFGSPLRCAVQNGGPSASGRHLGWPRKMRSSKMATGSGRAAILHRAPQWGSEKVPYTTIIFFHNIDVCDTHCWSSFTGTRKCLFYKLNIILDDQLGIPGVKITWSKILVQFQLV